MLEIKNISLNMGDEKNHADILKGIDFSFKEKKIYVITGPNGGGKSSLARGHNIKPGTKGESVHIPVILSSDGLLDAVYNTFEVGAG